MKRVAIVVILLMLITTTLIPAGYASKKNTASNLPQGTLVVAQPADAPTLDPQRAGGLIGMSVVINMFDTLLTRGKDGKLEPGLATEWKWLDDNTIQLKLRRGVKFHDGEPFNAEAVKFSFSEKRITIPKTGLRMMALREIKRVDIVDDYTVNVVTSKPDPVLLAKMTLFGGLIVPPKYIQEKGDDYFAQHPVGTGPFKFVEWRKDDRVVMEANPDYWRGAPKIKKLVFKTIPNDADRVAALLAGEVDVISNVPPDAIETVNRAQGVRTVAVPGLRVQYVSLDTRKGPLAKKEVRQALNYAVDVDSIIKNVLGGMADRLATLLPREAFGYDPSIVPYPYDPGKARRLLAQAGYPDGFEIELDTNSGVYPKDKDVSQAIAGQLAQVGVKANVKPLETGTFTSLLTSGKIAPMYFIGNLAWSMDGSLNLQSFVKSDRRYARMENSALDKLVDVEENTVDPAKRQAAFSEIQRILKDGAYFIYLYQGKDIYGLNDEVVWDPPHNQVLWMYEASLKTAR